MRGGYIKYKPYTLLCRWVQTDNYRGSLFITWQIAILVNQSFVITLKKVFQLDKDLFSELCY